MGPALPFAFPAIVPQPTSGNSPCLSGRALPASQAQVVHLYSGHLARAPKTSFSHTELFGSLDCCLGFCSAVGPGLPVAKARHLNCRHCPHMEGPWAVCLSTYLIKSHWSAAQDSHKGNLLQGLLDSEDTLVIVLGTSPTPMIVLRVHLQRDPA